MSGSSEERELPASKRKLLKAREKGQVAHSHDLVIAFALMTSVAYLVANLGGLIARMREIWRIPKDFHDQAVSAALRETSTALVSTFLEFVIPLFLCVVISAILANMMIQKGLVVSFTPLVPDFNRVNPFEGLKNLFGLSKLIDLIKAVFKLSILGTGGILMATGFLNQLMWVPTCGPSCIAVAWVELLKMLAGLSIAVFAVNGLIDMRLQIWLFLRGQRMTKTERKQEAKNQNQSPEVKGALKRHARAMRAGDGKGGIKTATLVIGDRSVALGIRFVRNETPAPLCVCKARGALAKRLILDADKLGVPVHFDATLAEALYPHSKQMGFLPASSYPTLAQIFKENKLL